MTMQDTKPSFIVDCPVCKAKVAAEEHGRIMHDGVVDEDGNVYYGTSVALGVCPKCRTTIVGESRQIGIATFDSDDDEWADAIRVYPEPTKTFTSTRIPKVVSDSISEAVKSLQANANVAACVMLGRALEAICLDLLGPPKGSLPPTPASTPPASSPPPQPKRPIMLGEGIKRLKEKGVIDQRLYDWSQQLHAFRNLAAHPTDITISREDADDLKSFVYAIIEYIYDLTDRYNDFQARLSRKKTK